MSANPTHSLLLQAFDRQVEALLEKGFPAVAGVTEQEFLRQIEPLRSVADGPAAEPGDPSRIPFVLVVKGCWVHPVQALPLAVLKGKSGFTDMEAADLDRFGPIEGLEIPGAQVYLALDVDTGAELLNVTPDDALITIRAAGRSPLTLAEGVAVVVQFPELLKSKNCFSMLGSRCGDRRVTALWLSSGRPRLGWCWAGNPHTWLGSASCGGRTGD